MLLKFRSRLNQLQPSILFLILAVLLGGFIRLMPVLDSNFPLNDGGLFYTMTQELVGNGFKLPQFTNYNNLQIPFAYPPLGFYLAGGLHKLTGWELLDIFRILPAVFTVLSIPAFYLLAKAILEDEMAVSFSVLAFSFLPVTMAWLVMGGGITRAPGFVFSLLALTASYYCFTRKRLRDLVLTIIFSTLTVLFHPEAAVHTAAGIFMFFIFKGRHKKGLISAGVVLLFVLLLSAPWWFPVIQSHSFSPFLAAGKTGIHNFTNYANFLLFNITGEYGLTSIGVLAFIGIFFSLVKKKTLLPVWLLVTFLAGPRSANLYETPIIAVLAGEMISFLIEKTDSLAVKGSEAVNEPTRMNGLVSKLLFTILLFQWGFSAIITISSQAADLTLYSSDVEAMDWVKDNTPEGSAFLVLSGSHPLMDAVSEWFPAMSGRVSAATVQGYEWIEGTDFIGKMDASLRLQNCILQDLGCVDRIEEEVGWGYDYIFLRRYTKTKDYGKIPTDGLSNALSASSRFSLVYEAETILVYKVYKAD